jgi:hypothetical protein
MRKSYTIKFNPHKLLKQLRIAYRDSPIRKPYLSEFKTSDTTFKLNTCKIIGICIGIFLAEFWINPPVRRGHEGKGRI